MQTSYSQNPAAGQLGLLADSSPSRIVTGFSDAVIPWGRMVSYDAAQDKVKLPAAATDISDANSESRPVAGIVVASKALEEQPANTLGVADADVPAYPALTAFSVIRQGVIWVWSEQAVAPTDQVFVRHTASGNEKPGNFRKDADTANATLLQGARFMTETAAAGLVQVEINLTN